MHKKCALNMRFNLRFLVLLVTVLALVGVVKAMHSTDVCDRPGELRRRYGCVAVRHTKADACCWLKEDGTHGSLPYTCCGTGWKAQECESLIDRVCSTHPDDM
jgi:hypothetical protein